jgi:hypothetical protein
MFVFTVGIARSDEVPHYLQSFLDNGVIASIAPGAPTMTITAGAHLQELTPESRQDICQLTLDYYHGTDASVTAAQIVDSSGQVLTTCGG